MERLEFPILMGSIMHILSSTLAFDPDRKDPYMEDGIYLYPDGWKTFTEWKFRFMNF